MQIAIRDEDYLALLIEDNDVIQAAINQSKESLTIIKCSNNWGEAVEDTLYRIDQLKQNKA